MSCGSRTPAEPSEASPVDTLHGFRISGTVFENTPDGRRPVPNTPIERIIDQQGSAYIGNVTTTDANGRYTIPDVPAGAVFAVFAASWAQPCPAVTVVRGDTVLDIQVVRGPLYPTSGSSPMLSGVVFYRTPDGARHPYDTGVGFFSPSLDGGHINLVRGRTDVQGRFALCGLPLGVGIVQVNGGSDIDPGFRKSVTIEGDTVFEFEVPPPPQ
jgi:hypothetical protein